MLLFIIVDREVSTYIWKFPTPFVIFLPRKKFSPWKCLPLSPILGPLQIYLLLFLFVCFFLMKDILLSEKSIYIRIYVYVYPYVYVCMCMYKCVCIYVCVHMMCMYMCVYVYVYMGMCIWMCVYVCVCMCVYIYI